MFIDSHAHLDITLDCQHSTENTLISELSAILTKDLEYIVHISLNPFDFLKNYPIFQKNSKILFATGIYPDHVALPEFDEDMSIKKLKEVLQKFPHVAIGETGIDLKNSHYGTLEKQQALFRKQIELAEELNLPIVIHSRSSFQECYDVLKDYKVPAIMHCFSYGIKEAEQILERGDYISFAGLLTYKNSIEMQEVATMIPIDKVLFETDSPFLSPVPYRGKKNIPAHVEYTYRFFANLRSIPIEDLCITIKNNFTKAFLSSIINQ